MKLFTVAVLLAVSMPGYAITAKEAYELSERETFEQTQALLAKAQESIKASAQDKKRTAYVNTKGASIKAWRQTERELYKLGFVTDGYFPHTMAVSW